MQFNRLDNGLRRDQPRRINQAFGLEVTLFGQGHLRPVDGCRETHQVLQRSCGMQRGVKRRQDTAHAVANQRDVFHARVLLHAANAIRNEVEHVVVKLQMGLFPAWRIPVHHIDVVALCEQKLDQALPLCQVEDGRLAGRRHDKQQRHAIDLVRCRVIVVQAQGAATVHEGLGRQAHRWRRRAQVLEPLEATLDHHADLRTESVGHRHISDLVVMRPAHRHLLPFVCAWMPV
ncbi:hypothetical protein D3C85_939130 [compost metagenome]